MSTQEVNRRYRALKALQQMEADENSKLREKLDGTREERERLRARLAMLADGETRLRELEELPQLVEEYLKELPALVDRMPVVREYETVPNPRTEENPSGLYTLTPERIRHLPEEEVGAKRLAAEAARPRGVRGSGSCTPC